MIKREYEKYSDYIEFQSEKTLDPVKRKKWLNEEWRLKIDGFKNEFNKLSNYLKPESRCLCLGARTGQEVVALNELGVKNVIGIDIVPNEPYVVEGDIHNLKYEDESFDFVYTNIIDHSINPKKMVEEIERVLKVGGIFYLQIQLGINQDKYTEFEIKNPVHDVVSLFDQSYCTHVKTINSDGQINFAGMNVELVFVKDQKLKNMFEKYGNLESLVVPEEYQELWDNINLPTQTKKLDDNGITNEETREKILQDLSKRSYFLTRLCEVYNCKNICEVGTAEGWQYFSFCEYAKNNGGFVVSCDQRDVRHKEYVEKYEKFSKFYNGTSQDVSQNESDRGFDFFYIDGLHDKNSVLFDVANLIKTQSKDRLPVWVFDDFDERFGCYEDIWQIVNSSPGFKIWNVGLTASGKPSHQAMINSRFAVSEN